MKRTLSALICAVMMISAPICRAGAADADPSALSEALVIMDECGGEPGPGELEKLRGLGLDDSDIEGLEALNSMRKENGGAMPYVITASAVILLAAAAVVCTVAVRRKKT